MGSLNEITADFQIDILFTQYWHDPSLSFMNHSACIRNITMETRYLNKIWTPNTCIINSKSTTIHHSPTENIFFILYDVSFKIRPKNLFLKYVHTCYLFFYY